MPPTLSLGWIDFSATDRDAIKQALEQVRQKGAVDELGIGIVRDAFANNLFPGFSTIQTRAKYFVTVPRMVADYLIKPRHIRQKTTLSKYLEQEEERLGKRLVDSELPDHLRNETGIFGANVARKPYSVYWNGLRQFGIINTDLSVSQFERQIAGSSEEIQADHEDDAFRVYAPATQFGVQWPNSESWDKSLNHGVHLSRNEADFLRRKLQQLPERTIPFQLYQQNPEVLQEAMGCQDFRSIHHFLKESAELPGNVKNMLALAQEFSNVLYGAHIRFNLVLTRAHGRDELYRKIYRQYWQRWLHDGYKPDNLSETTAENWLTHVAPKVDPLTKQFLGDWCRLAGNNASEKDLDALIVQRVKSIKGQRSLYYRGLRDDFQWAGMAEQSFRWPNVRTILTDVERPEAKTNA